MSNLLVVQTDPEGPVSPVLTAAGHDVQTVYTPREAMPIIRDGGIDLLVIDSYDPRVRIPELARQLDELPDAPPIVLVSSSPFAPEISAKIGASAFLPKPCEEGELVTVVESIVRHNRPVRLVEG